MIVNNDKKVKENHHEIVGLLLCIAGVIAMIVWGIILIFNPETNNQIGEASMLTIDGNGMFLIVCVLIIVAGAILLLKKNKN